jgi:prepilin-type N-terminal cleavage/methylation domain-containing protein
MKNKGFTLIEVILVLVVLGVLAVMVVPYYMSGVTSSSVALNSMNSTLSIQSVMAKIVADYNNPANSTYRSDLTAFLSYINTNAVNYGLVSGYWTYDSTYKFQTTDVANSLKLTITNNSGSSREYITYIFTAQSW